MTKQERKNVEMAIRSYLLQKNIYQDIFGSDKWIISISPNEADNTAAEMDKQGADVAICDYSTQKCVDEKFQEKVEPFFPFKIGAGRPLQERGLFWSECITDFYNFVRINSNIPINQIVAANDIISLDILIVSKKELVDKIEETTNLTCVDIFAKAVQLSRIRNSYLLLRNGIRLFNTKTGDGTIYINIPNSVLEGIAVCKGVV